MHFIPALLLLALSGLFESSIDQAFTAVQNKDWTTAASSLDQASREDSAAFAANNLHYLRGRVAEMQNDWTRAREEFNKAGDNNPLRWIAAWHAARASMRVNDDASAEQLLSSLPKDFPPELKLEAAREAGPALATKIYQDVPTREARFQIAKLKNDTAMLWNLLRESKDDDVGLDAARLVLPSATETKDQMDVAQAFFAHRQFDQALLLYEKASNDPDHPAEAKYQIARIRFQLQNYPAALNVYKAIASEFDGTDWQKQAEYQIALCYWRMDDYQESEKAYQNYIRKYGSSGMEEAATRNLIDIYRVVGENQKAIQAIDRAMKGHLSVAGRQVLLFTKAKILYSQKRYAVALLTFQQLRKMRLRSAPGAATAGEIEYLVALCLSNLGNKASAENIWQKLAHDPFSYYGQRAAEKLGVKVASSDPMCLPADAIGKMMEADLSGLIHPLRTDPNPAADVVAELIFLHLWDEAALWLDRSPVRIAPRTAAEIAFLGGRYNRSIIYADRLPKTESILPLLYPAGYPQTICNAATSQKADPLWLHAIIWQESKYNPSARSGAAARGLMQFIPETAQAVATSLGLSDLTLEKLYDPATSIQLGARYWSMLLDQLKSPEMALAAYNGGADNVEKWKRKSSDPELFVADIGFPETKKYVMSVFAAHAAYGALAR